MNNTIHLTDNLREGGIIEGESAVRDIISIANIGKIGNAPDILVFPHSFADLRDGIADLSVLNIRNLKFDDSGSCKSVEVTTGNLMGFVGINNTSVSIHSRFTSKTNEAYDQDFFLYYMLQKVFSVNVFNLEHSTDKDDKILDFLLFLFPIMLKNALSQGLYKEYTTQHNDDSRIKGSIEINNFIRYDKPFRGNVSYRTRQYSYDNSITQLVRHTIEYIKHHPYGSSILNNDSTTKECVSQIVMSTPSYNHRERNRILKANMKPKVHPYFLRYRELQMLCMRILRHDSLKYGADKDKVYGVLFDGAWLWEEYLYTILKKSGFKHPLNKEKKGGVPMFANGYFDNNRRLMYPDFYKKDFVLDAKYKHLRGDVGRDDLYQVVSYMYCMNFPVGGFVYPDDSNDKPVKHKLAGVGQEYHNENEGVIRVIPFQIPLQSDDWKSFIEAISVSENNLTTLVHNYGNSKI